MPSTSSTSDLPRRIAAIIHAIHAQRDRAEEWQRAKRGPRQPSRAEQHREISARWHHTTPFGERITVSAVWLSQTNHTRLSWWVDGESFLEPTYVGGTWLETTTHVMVSGRHLDSPPDFARVDAGLPPADYIDADREQVRPRPAVNRVCVLALLLLAAHEPQITAYAA